MIQSGQLNKLTRRAFLNQLSLLFGSSLAAELLVSQQCLGREQFADAVWNDSGVFQEHRFELAPWSGDDFTRGHELRDVSFPTSAIRSSRVVDFVVVGGGLAGLTAAHYLKDHDVLILEQYPYTGGQSRGSTRYGLAYPFGAASLRPPEHEVADLLADLGLQPVKFEVNRHNWHTGERNLADSSSSQVLIDDFRRFERESRKIFERLASARGLDIAPELKRLDETLFLPVVTSYSAQFQLIVDSILRTSCCLGLDKVSALAGYMTMRDIYAPSYAFAGGNGAITNALSRKLLSSSRMICGAFVWSMNVTESGVNIIYSDSAGYMHEVHTRHAIVTVPPMVAARILKNLDNQSKISMLAFRYGSYLVANCFFSRPVYDGAFSSWYGSPISFSNILNSTEPDRSAGERSKDMRQVLTVYQPYVPGSEGRSLLQEGDRTKFSRGILEQMTPISAQLAASLESIALSRWGHAMPVMSTGYFARMARLISLKHPSFSLCHSSSQGAQCAESAVLAARLAVDEALKIKAQARPLYSVDLRT